MTKLSLPVIVYLALVVLESPVLAQQQQQQQQPPVPPVSANPFDLSAAREAMGSSLPTVSSVAALEQKALAVFASGDCKAASDALDPYAREANSLSNYIARGLKPYYDGSYDERKAFPAGRLSQLAPIERLSNDYKGKRNRAMVMQAECLAKMGESAKAAALYYQVLGLIDIEDTEWWDRARNSLNALLAVK